MSKNYFELLKGVTIEGGCPGNPSECHVSESSIRVFTVVAFILADRRSFASAAAPSSTLPIVFSYSRKGGGHNK